MADAGDNKAASSTAVPRSVALLEVMLQSMGVTSYEKRVLEQLLEVLHTYTSDVLDVAESFAKHADRDIVTVRDVELAAKGYVQSHFEMPPPRAILMAQAERKNSIPLPPLPTQPGVVLTDQQKMDQPNLQYTAVA